MYSVTISREWYNELASRNVGMMNPYFYNDSLFGEHVEVDILNQQEFESISKELGWI